jgi:hypothetical protein
MKGIEKQKELQRLWAATSAEDREPYKRMEKEDKERYAEEMKGYEPPQGEDKGSDDGGGRDRKARRRDTNGSEAAAAADADEDAFAALRRKRLERERVERRREAHLLAQVDMYGPAAAAGPVLDERTLRYHSQYNPALARPM